MIVVVAVVVLILVVVVELVVGGCCLSVLVVVMACIHCGYKISCVVLVCFAVVHGWFSLQQLHWFCRTGTDVKGLV